MKMIASTKLAKAQRAMVNGKQYGIANSGVYPNRHCLAKQANAPSEVFQNAPSDTPSQNKLYIVISSDKGLCGGIHSSVSKATRRAIADASSNPDSPIMVIGDKSKAQLSRALPQNLALTFNQIGRDIPTFSDAAGVADLIVKSGVKYDSVNIIYNKFVSALSYEAGVMEVLTENALKEARELCFASLFNSKILRLLIAGFKAYEMEDDVTKDLAEFSLANAIYAALVEAHACEQSARYGPSFRYECSS